MTVCVRKVGRVAPMFLAAGVLMGLAACGESGKGSTGQGFVGGPRPSSAGNAIVQVGDTPTVKTSLIVKNTLPHWVSVFAVQGSGVDFDPKGIVPDPPTYKTCASKLGAFRRRQGVNPTPAHARPGEVIETPKMECEQMYIDLKQRVVPDPPAYKNCIAKLQALAKSGTDQTGVATSAAKKECEQRYVELKGEALTFLTRANWLEGEAKEQGVRVSAGEVQKEFERYKRVEFGGRQSALQSYLDSSGENVSDLALQVKLSLLASKIEQKVRRVGLSEVVTAYKKKNASESEVKDYYNKHKGQLDKPKLGDIRVIFTKTEAQARSAIREIGSGQSFASVAKRVSTDPETKASGGLIPEVPLYMTPTTNEQPEIRYRQDLAILRGQGSLGNAVPNEVIGPESSFQEGVAGNFYIYELTKIYPTVKQTLAEFKQQVGQEAWGRFIQEFGTKWKKTNGMLGG